MSNERNGETTVTTKRVTYGDLRVGDVQVHAIDESQTRVVKSIQPARTRGYLVVKFEKSTFYGDFNGEGWSANHKTAPMLVKA